MTYTPETELVKSVRDVAPQFYDPDYPYHNFDGHITTTVEKFLLMCDWLEERSIPINRHQGEIGVLQHDYLFHVDHIARGFKTKEQLSAFESRKQNREFGASPYTIRTISGIIIATTVGSEPKTNLEKAVRISDVGNVNGSPAEFLHNTYLNVLEMIHRGIPLPDSFEEFRKITKQFLSLYYNKPVVFTHKSIEVPFDPMNDIAQNNLSMLGSLGLKKFIETVGTQVGDIEDKLPSKWLVKKIF